MFSVSRMFLKIGIRFLAGSILLMVIHSCIYYPPEEPTYVNSAYNDPVISNQKLDMNKDTILIWSLTRLNFDLKSDGATIWMVAFSYLDKSIQIGNTSGYIDVDPVDYPDGTYKLKMTVTTATGTGSLADHQNMELITTEKEWVLIIERPYSQKVLFTHTTIENGFLKIYWDKLKSPYFHSYRIEVDDSALYHRYSRTIYDQDSTSLTDSSFVGGKVQFSLIISYYDNSGILHEWPQDTYTYRYPVDLYFEEDLDTLTFSWTSIPFRHTTHLISSLYPNTDIDPGSDTLYKIAAPGVGGPLSYELSVDPVVDLTYDHQMYHIYKIYTVGTETEMTFSEMLYDPESNLYYLKDAMHFRKFDGTDFTLSGSYDYSWDYHDNSSIALSADKSNVYTTVSQELIRLSSASFALTGKDPLSPSNDGIKTYHGMKILNDSIMYIVYNSMLAIYNYRSREIVDYTAISGGNGTPSQTTFSSDGQYAANCGDGIFRVFRNTDNRSLDQIYEAAGDYWECIFDPVNEANLLVVSKQNNVILHCPGMELLYTFPANIYGMAVNFDPVTNYLMLVSTVYNTITIYDYQNDLIKFKCNHHNSYTDFYLANNLIFHNAGFYLNTGSYVK
jgi:hypothetical protein